MRFTKNLGLARGPLKFKIEIHLEKTFPLLCSLRNKDFQEVTLERDGVVLLQFALAYGFRNIQNLVQKLKRGKCPYHYVEVMACPSGEAAQGHIQGWEELQGIQCRKNG